MVFLDQLDCLGHSCATHLHTRALSLSKGFDKLSPNGFMNNSCRINSQLHGQLEQLVQAIRMQHIAQLWPRQPNWSKKTI